MRAIVNVTLAGLCSGFVDSASGLWEACIGSLCVNPMIL